MTAGATASRAAEPTEQEKTDALRQAYRGHAPIEPVEDDIPGIWPKLVRPPAPRRVRKTSDICTRHGMHKKVSGKSWRCVR